MPLLVALAAATPQRAFLLGLLTGVVYFTGTLYWITRVMTVYGDLAWWVALPVHVALILFLGLFPALFAVMVRLIATGTTAAPLWVPLVWVATELGRTYALSGFPWVLLGYSQVDVLPIAQAASVFGVYGVSALVAAVNAALAAWVLAGAPHSASRARRDVLTVGAIVVLAAVWGDWRVRRSDLTREGEAIQVGLVQGNVDQAQKWDPTRASAIFDGYLQLTQQAIDAGAQFAIWPESSTPFTFEDDRPQAERIRALARRARVEVLLGSNQVERTTPPRFFNAAFLVAADGSTEGTYRKTHLVPFGEYVPLKPLLFFASPLVEAVSDFTAGDGPVILPIRGGRVSTAICYEIVYPNLVRRSVVEGSQLLTTITNDAWFGRTSAPHQHFAQASMRAIENGRYLVRAANTGVSGIVDPYGRVLARSALFEPAVIVGAVRLVSAATVYTRIGDIFAYASVVTTVAMLLLARSTRRTNRLK